MAGGAPLMESLKVLLPPIPLHWSQVTWSTVMLSHWLAAFIISSTIFHYFLCLGIGMGGTEWAFGYSGLAVLTVLSAGFAIVLPAKLPASTGTHVNCSPDMAIAFFACCCLCTFDLRVAMLLCNYTLVSEALLPTKYVRWE